ncbi:MAG TPA: hypothetical protein VFK38_07535 [Candidatus Limnocylindrales bacterium]|nr:hypothetical protein [Candidatus Limnocylindrales bacterium]
MRRPPVRRPGPARIRLDRAAVPPILAALGLLVAAVFSFGLLDANVGLGLGPGGPGPGGPARTPNPSVVYTPPPEQRASFTGSILFAKAGSIWAARGTEVRRLTEGPNDSSPAWLPDGSGFVFVETRERETRAPSNGRDSTFVLRYPVLMRAAADGSGRKEILDGLLKLPGGPNRYYFTWLLQPDVSPDGRTIALVSDAPDPFARDVTLSLLPLAGGKVQNLDVRQTPPLGHNDPAWSPDGKRIAFSYNARNGPIGAPRIVIYTLEGKRLRYLTGGGYARPSWSPDGRYVVAERTDGKGRDLVVISVRDGSVVSRLTRDGASIAPTWGPDGRHIAYLKVEGLSIDLHVLTLSDDGAVTATEDKAITSDSQLDGTSPPAWYVAPEEMPTPAPTQPGATSPSPCCSGSPPPTMAP